MHTISADVPAPHQQQPLEWQEGMGGKGDVRVIECGGFCVHRACLFIHAVKHAQMLLFGDE